MSKSVDDMLQDARQRLCRVNPTDAKKAHDDGALLVDIRPAAQRADEGEIPDALVIERNVLEWRFDLQREWHIEQATDYEQRVIVFCSEGYTSSLAAAALQDLGYVNATDLEGGFKAWQARGLPTFG